jgi:transposase
VSGRKHELARRKGPYSHAFKDEAVRVVMDGDRPVVARELEIHDTTLHNSVNAWRREHTGGAAAAARNMGEGRSERNSSWSGRTASFARKSPS